MKKTGWIKLVLCSALLLGCSATSSIHQAIRTYHQQEEKVALGQSKTEVLAVLQPTQDVLPPKQSKPREIYREGETLKEIYFFRSRSFDDGLVTDDEFTPYVFSDGVLVAIGWSAIGGPKTQAQTRRHDNYCYYHDSRMHY